MNRLTSPLPALRRLSAMAVALAAAVAAAPAQAQNAQAQLYSQQAVNNLCEYAQRIIVPTSLTIVNNQHVWNDEGSFIFSSSAPYMGPNLSAYNAKGDFGDNLPLTMQQAVVHGTTASGWTFPRVVSCKMKDAEAIAYHFGPTAVQGPQTDCRTVNQDIVNRVYAALTTSERRLLRYPQTSIVFDPDQIATSGPNWVGSLPDLFPNVIRSVTAGELRIRSRAIAVSRLDPTDLAGPDKKGTFYCHLPTPEYLRNVILGQVQPCTANSAYCS